MFLSFPGPIKKPSLPPRLHSQESLHLSPSMGRSATRYRTALSENLGKVAPCRYLQHFGPTLVNGEPHRHFDVFSQRLFHKERDSSHPIRIEGTAPNKLKQRMFA
jgi:hypothetical protein